MFYTLFYIKRCDVRIELVLERSTGAFRLLLLYTFYWVMCKEGVKKSKQKYHLMLTKDRPQSEEQRAKTKDTITPARSYRKERRT